MTAAREPRWVSRLVVDAVHLDLIRSFGGFHGIRDESALESALARPKQRWSYEPASDLAQLAAAYGFGLARNHPFQDGNKRIAFVVMAVFAGLNGQQIVASEADVVTVMLAVAAGEMAEDELAEWLGSCILRA